MKRLNDHYPKRTPLLCYAFILSFAFVLMAFEYQVPFFIPDEEVEWKEQEAFRPPQTPPPERPEPKKKATRSEKEDPVDHSLEPKDKKDRKSGDKDVLDEDVFNIDGVEDDEKVRDSKIPKYRDPDKPVERHRLSRFAVLEGCAHLEDEEKRRNCSDRRLMEFLREKTPYPDILREQDIEGKAHLAFIVGRDGELREIRVEQSSHPRFTKALKKAVKELPPFVPAEQKGHRVSTWVSIPVNFSLR